MPEKTTNRSVDPLSVSIKCQHQLPISLSSKPSSHVQRDLRLCAGGWVWRGGGVGLVDAAREEDDTAVLTAVLFGLAASSALVIGAVVGARWSPPKQVTGVLLAFASGALIAALAFELFEESFAMGGPVRAGLGLLAGAATFVAVDTALDRYVSGRSGPEQREVIASGARSGLGLALLAAVTLDGVPENLALGVSLVGGASLSLLVAIFFQPARGTGRRRRHA